jgi:photosystem II stability/assembly factor-like uncharacterized protein
VLISIVLSAAAACSSAGKTSLVGIEHLECSPEIRFIDHSVVCARQRHGGWPYECEIHGSIENSGSDTASGVSVWVEYGHELQGVRSMNWMVVGDLAPGEKADFADGFGFYESLAEYDIRIECADLIVAHPSPVPTAVNSFSSHGPRDAVYTLAIDPAVPTTLYAGTEAGGVFKSVDGGVSWVAINIGMTNRKIGALVIDPIRPATIYAGTYGTDGTNGAAYKSVDGGDTWTDISNEMGGAYVLSMAIDPHTPSTIYAGTSDGMFRSTGGGEGWQMLNSGLSDDPYILDLFVDPLTPASLYACDHGAFDSRIAKSTNGGENWSMIDADLRDISSFAIDPLTPTTLYAGTWTQLHKSTDGGRTWNELDFGLDRYHQVMALAIDPTSPATVYAALRDKDIFKSTDGGENWSALDTNLAGVYVHCLAVDPVTPTIIYATTDTGVFVLGR